MDRRYSLNKKCTVCGVTIRNDSKTCLKHSHRISGMLGKTHSIKSKLLMSKIMMGNKNPLGIKRSNETKLRMRKAALGKVFSKQTKEKMSIARRKLKLIGNKAAAWKGGLTAIVELIRKGYKYVMWRQAVFIRDNFTCQHCGARGVYLHAHHIIPFNILLKEAAKYMPLINLYEAALLYTPLWEITNGITLCKKCHRKEHNKRGNR